MTFQPAASSACRPSRPAPPALASAPVSPSCRWQVCSNTLQGRMPPFELAEPEDHAEPFCPYFGTCGGCTLQHYGPATYFALKQELVESAKHKAHVAAPVAAPIEAHGDGR